MNENKEDFTKERIRIAVGETIIERSNIKNNTLKRFISRDMEYAFSQNSAFVVTDNNKSQTNKVLAQQVLDELSKGRETGLPLGSLRGVDYLIFNTIEYVQFNNKKIKFDNLKSIGILNKKVKQANAKLSGYVYLIDVNTGNKKASVPVTITHKFNKNENLYEAMLKTLSKKFVTKASNEIFTRITPLVVDKIEGMSVLLNNGKNVGINKDDIYDVYSKSEVMMDKRTGQNYESGGMPVAKIKIESFNNRDKAIATIIKGNINRSYVAR